MNAAEFISRRARIERNYHGRGRMYQRALAHLVQDARAALVVFERKIIGYRLPNGQFVCMKVRYYDEAHALDAIKRIQAEAADGQRVPVRVYPCQHCHGWHATSQPRHATR